jgi:hypothetical protein
MIQPEIVIVVVLIALVSFYVYSMNDTGDTRSVRKLHSIADSASGGYFNNIEVGEIKSQNSLRHEGDPRPNPEYNNDMFAQLDFANLGAVDPNFKQLGINSGLKMP